MNISQAARITGLSSKTIRDYEQAGLIAAPERGANGYRQYTVAHIDTLHFIKHAREVDFSLAQIAGLLALRNNPGRASADVKALVGEHIPYFAAKNRPPACHGNHLSRLARALSWRQQPGLRHYRTA